MATPRHAAVIAFAAGLIALLSACTDSHVTASDTDVSTGFADSTIPLVDTPPAEDTLAEVDADALPEVTPDADVTPEVAPDTTADADVAPEITPDATPDADVTPEITPDATPDADVAPEITPDAAPDATPDADVAPEITPDATPDVALDVTPDAGPDATPDATPDVDAAVDVVPDAIPDADATPDAIPDADATPDAIPDADAAPDADADADADAIPDATPDLALPVWLLAPPAGTLAFMPGETCPDGWHPLESARGRLLKATSDGGEVGLTVGSALTSTAPPQHSHGFSTQMSVGSTGIAGATGCCTGGFGQSGSYPVSGSTAAATDGMPAVHEVLCEIDAVDLGEDGHPFPTGAVLFFNALSCPKGFENVPAADGRFIVGTPAGGTPGATVGDALSSGQTRVHAHQVGASINVSEKSISAAGGGNHELAAKGAHSFSVQSAQVDSGWPYIQLLACRALPNPAPPGPVTVDDSALPAGTLAWFEFAGCPAGWSPVATHEGRFGAALAAGAPAAALGTPLAPFEDRLHSHGFSGSFNLPERQVALIAGCCNKSPGAKGGYSYSGTSGASAGGLPYLTLTACARD